MTEAEKQILQKRIAEVEIKISQVSAQRKELEENAKNAKAEVHLSIGCQLERLRQREVQLTRQVDALIGHQGSLLQLQLAKLYQELGRLRAAQAFGHQAQITISPDRELCPTVAVRHLHYSSPTEGDLCLAIQTFGRFEGALGSSRPSVLLLPDEEAYEDSDHHLMHKTLEDKMQWAFPKPPPPTKRDEWVQNMKIEDFEMSDCESIELLCPPDMQDKGFWLLNNKNSAKNCTCEEKGTMEIENLASLTCATHDKWNKEDFKPLLPIPDVANTCLSQSSKCSSFRDCTCPENCLLTHLREQTKRLWLEEPQKKQDCINNTLKEALKVDRNLWLNKAARKNDRSEWLLKSSNTSCDDAPSQLSTSEHCQSLKKQMKELFFDSANSEWLSNKRIKSNDGWISTRC